MIILDSSFLIGYKIEDDQHHEKAKSIMNKIVSGEYGDAIISDYIFDEVIAVSAIDNQGKLANFSSRGDKIAFGAPGVNIYSTYLNNQYAVLNGTSQASPFIAGACALLLAWTRIHPETPQIKTSDDMLRMLSRFTDEQGRLSNGEIGFGIPHFANTILDDPAPAPDPVPTPLPPVPDPTPAPLPPKNPDPVPDPAPVQPTPTPVPNPVPAPKPDTKTHEPPDVNEPF